MILHVPSLIHYTYYLRYDMEYVLANIVIEKYLLLLVVSLEDRTITTAKEQTIICSISGLSENTPVTWIDPDNNDISNTDTDNYVIDQGSFAFGIKSATLTITTAKLATLTSGDTFKCKLKSTLYATYSPDVEKEMTLTLLELGKSAYHLIHLYCNLVV